MPSSSPRRAPSRRSTALRRSAAGLLALAGALTLVLVGTGPAAAADGDRWEVEAILGDGVSGLEVDRTTRIESEVWAIESAGPYMLVGGAFLEVRDRTTYAAIPRPYLAAFDPTTGEYVPWFATQPDGPVYDIVDLGDGRVVIAGEFHSVNGVPGTERVAIVEVATGRVDTRYSFDFDDNANSVVRAVAVHGNRLHLTGAFSRIRAGGVEHAAGGLARVSLVDGRLDTGWLPTLQGGGGWGIGVASGGRVFVGGYFETVNGVDGTETLAALRASDGSLVPGWNHGFPHRRCAAGWRSTCGAVNGLAVVGDRVFVAGAKHFWSALDTSDGTILANNEITNDGQSVDVIGDRIVVGCHCETPTRSDEFNDIAHRYHRIIDPVALTEVESPTVNSRGAAGGWAAGLAPDGCVWTGGNLSSTFVDGRRHPAWNLLRFCPVGGAGTNPAITGPAAGDTVPPANPTAPTIAAVRGASVDLRWPAVTDDGGQVVYLVFRNGELVGRTARNEYTDALLPYQGTYVWRVAAVDPSGNQTEASPRSTPVRIGRRVNVARQATATQVSDDDATTRAERAIDGVVSNNAATQLPSRTGALGADVQPWIDLDLGRDVHVDSVQLRPRRDADFRESNNRPVLFHDTSPITAQNRADAATDGHRAWQGDVARDDAAPRIDLAPLAAEVRHIRIFNAMKRISFDEIRVYTTNPQPTPAMPSADTTDPTDPRWSRVLTRGSLSVLEWGGATDDRGVAWYDVYRGTELLGRTTDTRLVVGPAGALSRDVVIVAVDAAGNTSRVVGDSPVAECVAARDGATIEISWSGAETADRYVIRRSVDGGTAWWRGSVESPASTSTDDDRSGEIVYTVEARYGAVAAEPTTCTTEDLAAPPGRPGPCTWTRNAGAIDVVWGAADGEDDYIVERRVDGGTWWWRGRVDTTSFVDTDRDATLEYRVRARNAQGTGPARTCTAA